MKQKLSNLKQVVIGAVIVYSIWLIGFLAMEDPLCLISDYSPDIIWWIKDIIAVSTPFVASLSLIIFAIISKRYNYKYIYYSALVFVVIPILISILTEIEYDTDSSLATVILMPIYTLLQPFALASEVIDGLSYTLNLGYIVACMLLIISISVVAFIRTKSVYKNVNTD